MHFLYKLIKYGTGYRLSKKTPTKYCTDLFDNFQKYFNLLKLMYNNDEIYILPSTSMASSSVVDFQWSDVSFILSLGILYSRSFRSITSFQDHVNWLFTNNIISESMIHIHQELSCLQLVYISGACQGSLYI